MINKHVVEYNGLISQGLNFYPENSNKLPHRAIFTHGHTSHKGSILNWGIRLREAGIATTIFDLPGHYLGHYSEVEDFEVFKSSAHYLFEEHLKMNEKMDPISPKGQTDLIVFGGHSLGGLMALKSATTPHFQKTLIKDHRIVLMGVGLGMAPINKKHNHIFETAFFKKTLDTYQQLVSPAIRAPQMFEWIKNEKENLQLKSSKVYLLTGKDDIVSSPEQTTYLSDNLKNLGNEVECEIAESLPHHYPDRASSFIMSYLKSYLNLKMRS